jgi:putative transposase
LKAYKFKLRLTQAVERKIEATLALCCELYNAGLAERRGAYEIAGKSISYPEQANQLPQIKQSREEFSGVHSQVLQQTLKRLQLAFDNFFRRRKAGQPAGYPRFRSRRRDDSFTYPQSGWRLENRKLYLSKIGSCRVHLSRPIEGQIKTCTIKREADGWFVVFAVEANQSRYIPRTGEEVGVDLGIENFATLSNGEEIENPRYLRQAEGKLKTAQRHVSRKQRGGKNRGKAVKLLARHHLKVKRQRLDYFHKRSLELIHKYDQFTFEDLKIKGLLKNHHLAKSISDAAWGTFVIIHTAKAAEAGRVVKKVPAAFTSQDCSVCGARVRKSLAQREHRCVECGYVAQRDHNAARNIKKKGG